MTHLLHLKIDNNTWKNYQFNENKSLFIDILLHLRYNLESYLAGIEPKEESYILSDS